MRIVSDKMFLNIPKMEIFYDNSYGEKIDAFLRYVDLNPLRLSSRRLECPCSNDKNKNMLDWTLEHYAQHLLHRHFDRITPIGIVMAKEWLTVS